MECCRSVIEFTRRFLLLLGPRPLCQLTTTDVSPMLLLLLWLLVLVCSHSPSCMFIWSGRLRRGYMPMRSEQPMRQPTSACIPYQDIQVRRASQGLALGSDALFSQKG